MIKRIGIFWLIWLVVNGVVIVGEKCIIIVSLVIGLIEIFGSFLRRSLWLLFGLNLWVKRLNFKKVGLEVFL